MLDNLSLIREILLQNQIRQFGICSFQEISRFLPCRGIARIPENPKSVLVFPFPYYVPWNGPTNLCAYARVPDYHQVVGDILKTAAAQLEAALGARFEGFTDVSPLPEKECALAAGVGFPGKNGLVIHPEYGSYFVLGELVTDLALPLSQPSSGSCMDCGRCIQSCPSGALSPQGFDPEKCLSAVTQRKGELTPQEEELIRKNGLAWGCDVCQQVCPHNAGISPTYLPQFSHSVEPVVTCQNLSALRKTRAFGYRSRSLMLRNLAVFGEHPDE